MKRSTPVVAVLVSVVLLGGSVDAAAGTSRTAENAEPWPLGLGGLGSAPARYPAQEGNPAAARLKVLALGVDVDFDATRRQSLPPLIRKMSTWTDKQIVRPDDAIDPLPADAATFLKSHDPQLNAIRELLVTSSPVWPVHAERAAQAPLPNLRAHVALSRLLVARGLARASWDDLHAAAALQHGLLNRPELISQLVALSAMRTIAAAARKLPAPAPPWLNQVTRFDVRRATLASVQWEAWAARQEAENGPDDPTSVHDRLRDVVMKPFDQLLAGNYVALLRKASVELASSRQCSFDEREFNRRSELRMPFWNIVARTSMPNLGRVWQRVARYEAEAEATENVFALKEGRPPNLKSHCSDGYWRVMQLPSGAKRLQFSRAIAVNRPLAAIPLEYTVGSARRAD